MYTTRLNTKSYLRVIFQLCAVQFLLPLLFSNSLCLPQLFWFCMSRHQSSSMIPKGWLGIQRLSSTSNAWLTVFLLTKCVLSLSLVHFCFELCWATGTFAVLFCTLIMRGNTTCAVLLAFVALLVIQGALAHWDRSRLSEHRFDGQPIFFFWVDLIPYSYVVFRNLQSRWKTPSTFKRNFERPSNVEPSSRHNSRTFSRVTSGASSSLQSLQPHVKKSTSVDQVHCYCFSCHLVIDLAWSSTYSFRVGLLGQVEARMNTDVNHKFDVQTSKLLSSITPLFPSSYPLVVRYRRCSSDCSAFLIIDFYMLCIQLFYCTLSSLCALSFFMELLF